MSDDTEAQAWARAAELLANHADDEGIPDPNTCRQCIAIVAGLILTYERTLAEVRRERDEEQRLREAAKLSSLRNHNDCCAAEERVVALTAELAEVRARAVLDKLSLRADLQLERVGSANAVARCNDAGAEVYRLSARLAAAQSYGAAVVGVCTRRDKHRECCPSHYNDTGVVLDALAVSGETVTDLRSSLASMTVERDEAVAKLESWRIRHSEAVEMLIGMVPLASAEDLRAELFSAKLAMGHAEAERRKSSRRGIELLDERDRLAKELAAAKLALSRGCVNGPRCTGEASLAEVGREQPYSGR